MEALEATPKDFLPLLVGDLNADLNFPWDRPEKILPANLGGRGCSAQHGSSVRDGHGPDAR